MYNQKFILISDSDVAVQTSAMKNLFINNLGLSPDKIFIYPVFTELKIILRILEISLFIFQVERNIRILTSQMHL